MKNFLGYLEETSEYLVQEGMLQELGKMSGDMNESVQRDFINEKTSFVCGRRSDADIDPDASGFDLITLDNVGMKIQSKVRVKTLHLEQTRRNSAENSGEASSTGHVSYSTGEFDVLMVSRPLGNKASRLDKYEDTSRPIDEYRDVEKWEMIAIPSKALEDPNRRGYLYNTVPKKVWGPYVGRAIEVLEEVYESVSNR
jgi:hypothetical protein